MSVSPLLQVRNFNVRFGTPDGDVHAVRHIDLQLQRGEVMGVVGESGCGKTQLFLGMLGLTANNGTSTGSVTFDGQELVGLPEPVFNKVRGNDISMVFQDPLSSLNPYLKIGMQLSEVLTAHGDVTRSEARIHAVDMLSRVGIPDAADRYNHYPHELSGGMRQRAMIAMAVLARPSLLIADEATTALDVTVQAQIIDLLLDLNRSLGMAIALITHDLGIVAETCESVAVMYAGRIVETGSVDDIFYDARHPYTQGLLQSIPRIDQDPDTDLPPISGQPPDLRAREQGCAFASRCSHRISRCTEERPNLRNIASERTVACHLNDR